jgi:hypothetical protein
VLVLLDGAQRWWKGRRAHLLKELQCRAGVFLLENIAADISSTGKDNLGKSAGKRRFIACIMCIFRLLPILASDADFRDVDFPQ